MSIKTTKREWTRIERIDKIWLLKVISRFRPKSKQRFVYEMIRCNNCLGGFSSAIKVKDCKTCSGLGKVKTKIKVGK